MTRVCDRALVLGLGPSARTESRFLRNERDLLRLRGIAVWGVNDADSICRPDFLVVVDCEKAFVKARRMVIRETVARTCFLAPTATWQPGFLARTERFGMFNVEQREPVRLPQKPDDDVPMAWTSVFAAVGLAYRAGARDIGVLGLDITDDHSLAGSREGIRERFGALWDALWAQGCTLVNLSPSSTVDSFPREDLRVWLRKQRATVT